MNARMKRAWQWMAWLVLAAAPWLTGLSHPFLYDDIGLISENSFLAEPANAAQVLTGRTLADPDVVNGRRPVVLATLFLDRGLYGLQPAGWRVTNLAWHLGNAALVAGLLMRLGAPGGWPLAAGMLFALYPAHVEAVHAPGFRADVLCLFWMLAALHGFLSVRRWPRAGPVWGMACAALALLSKETALAFPLLLGLLMVLFPAAFPPRRLARGVIWGLCAGLSAGFFVLWVALPTDLQAMGGSWNGQSLRFPASIHSLPGIWAHTLGRLIWPWPLNVSPHFAPAGGAASWRVAWGLLLLAGWMGLAFRWRQSRPWVAMGLGWILVLFLPVSNLIPLFHPVADRYLYTLAPGVAIGLAWGLWRLPVVPRWAGLAVLVTLYAAGVLAAKEDWRSGEALWTAAIVRNPHSATAASWLGLLREEAGDPDAAREWYATGTAANPYSFAAWLNWGILEGRQGNWAESERLLRRAIDVRPENPRGWHNLAVCLERQGRVVEAAEAAARGEEARSYGRTKP